MQIKTNVSRQKILTVVLGIVTLGIFVFQPRIQNGTVQFNYSKQLLGQLVICGNGALDFSEACDDSNTNNGDGCDATCQIEVGYTCTGEPSSCSPVCGDGYITGTEECDDSNTDSGDGCDNSCTIEAEYTCTGEPSVCANCGNGIIEPSEVCDDGNTDSGDGCNATCEEEEYGFSCTGEPSTCSVTCGDGVIAGTEACDDGNTTADDGCSDTCTVESGYSCFSEPSICANNCGNGTVNFGEECDDGVGNSDVIANACRTDCKAAYCSDGIVDSGEECDDGNLTNGDSCSSECLNEIGPFCGDGNLDPGEDCDDGAGNSNVVAGACRTDCKIQECGNALLDPGEDCDDGGANSDTDPDACRTDCTSAACGDSVVDTGEQCDDGNTSNTDSCLNSCINASCGDGYIWQNEEHCEPPNRDKVCNAYCRNWEGDSGGGTTGNSSSQEKVYTSQPTVEQYGCGNRLVEENLGEECDDGPSNGATNCSTDCTLLSCGDGIVSPQIGETCEPPPFADEDGGLYYQVPACGSFCVPPEQEGFAAKDYCTIKQVVSCNEEEEELEVFKDNYCGNGIIETGEQCDSGGVCQGGEYDQMLWVDENSAKACFQGGGIPEALSGDGCNDACEIESCGDGIVQSRGADGIVGTSDDEQCDNGRICAQSGLTCSTDDDCSGTDQCIFNILADETCNPRCKAKQCQYTYDLALPEYDASVHTIKLTVTDKRGISAVDATIFSIGDTVESAMNTEDEAESSALTASLFNWKNLVGQVSETITTTVSTDVTHYLQGVDSFAQISCSVYDQNGEKICDLGKEAFKLEVDGKVIEDAEFEEVDTGFCGDGVRQKNEECDDGNRIETDSCSSSCRSIKQPLKPATEEPQYQTPVQSCGNGIRETVEQCDDGNTINNDGCSNLCQIEERCGDNIVQDPEECDDGNALSNDGCSSTCTIEIPEESVVESKEYCGDALLNGDEECDEGILNSNDPDACRKSCINPVCGDGIVDTLEECDSGNDNSYEPDSCRPTCMLPTCGDGIVDIGEECDSTENCSSICTILTQEVCGNGIREEGEECDDGNSDNFDGCSSLCSVEINLSIVPECGNGALEFGEECDDGNSSNADTCSNECKSIVPASKTIPLERPKMAAATRLPLAMLQPIASPVYEVVQTGPGMLTLLASGIGIGVSVVRRKKKQ